MTDLSRIKRKAEEVANPVFIQRGRAAVYFQLKQACLEMEADPEYMDLCAAELDKTKILSGSEKEKVEQTLFMVSPAFNKSVSKQENSDKINRLKTSAKNFIGMFKIKGE